MVYKKLPKMSDAVFYEMRTKAMKNNTTMLDEINKLDKAGKLKKWENDYIAGFIGKKTYKGKR